MRYNLGNFKNVQESGNFEPLPPGEYDVEIAKIQETKASSGRDMVKLRYTVLKPTEYQGRIIFDQLTLIVAGEAGAGILKHFLHMVDEPFEDESMGVEPERWLGKKLSVVITIDKDYNTNKVKEHKEWMPF